MSDAPDFTAQRNLTPSQAEGGWKWAALILGAVLLTLIACLIGCLFGLLIGAAIGNQRGSETPLPEYYYEYPEQPWELPTPYPGSGPARLGVEYTMTEEGAEIVRVEDGSPAAEAGLRTGDIVTAVDGKAVNANHPLAERILAYNAGDEVTLTILRNGREQEIEVRLGAWTDLPLQLPIQ